MPKYRGALERSKPLKAYLPSTFFICAELLYEAHEIDVLKPLIHGKRSKIFEETILGMPTNVNGAMTVLQID